MSDAPPVIGSISQLVATDSLNLHNSNPREGDVGALVDSIRTNGFVAPLVAQRSSRTVLVGNHRLKAARALAMPEVPVVWVDVDDEQGLRILLADNRLSDLGAYDDGGLAAVLTDLATMTEDGLAGTGWESDALDALIANMNAMPIDPEPVAAATTTSGFTCPQCGWEKQ